MTMRIHLYDIITFAAAVWILLLCGSAGCVENVRPGIGITAPTGSSIARAQAYNQVARDHVAEGDKSGNRAFFPIIARVLTLQDEVLQDAARENQKAGELHQQTVNQLSERETQYRVIYDSWGARTERFVRRVFFWLSIAFVVHIVAGIAALFIPGGWGKAVAIVGAVVNPFAWFQTIRDNKYFRDLRPKLKREAAKKKR